MKLIDDIEKPLTQILLFIHDEEVELGDLFTYRGNSYEIVSEPEKKWISVTKGFQYKFGALKVP